VGQQIRHNPPSFFGSACNNGLGWHATRNSLKTYATSSCRLQDELDICCSGKNLGEQS